MKTVKLRLTGTAPLLMHNGRAADPLSPEAKALVAAGSKKKGKTDDDHAVLAKAEWKSGLYLDDAGNVCLPSEAIHAAIVAGARSEKLGKDFNKAILITEDMPKLKYTGPRDLDKLYADGNYVDRRPVKVGQQKVARTRPIFKDWSIDVEITYAPEVIADAANIVRLAQYAGKFVGVGDYRPKFGRFEVETLP